SIVRNEADIIEVFVRYHLKLFNRLIVVNHNSKDDTWHILQRLAAEGLPLEVRNEELVWHCQSEVMTALARDVWHTYRPDWIIPLDADEFLVNCDFSRLKEEMPVEEHVLFPQWHNYVPTEFDDPNEPNILKRMKYKKKVQGFNQHKSL